MQFGYLGPIIYNEVSRLRNIQAQQNTSSAVTYVSPSTLRTSPNFGAQPNHGSVNGTVVQRHNAGMSIIGQTSQIANRGVTRVTPMQGEQTMIFFS